mgnify:CR=1 FL=1|tara:strand:+ start:201 stop:722 length:522 start_codon:yes stop_codon:yes gene_type:complete
MKPPSRTSCWNYKVASVDRIIDGDTIDITIDLGFDLSIKQRVRVAGVDTPEKRTSDHEVEKPLGIDATNWLTTQLETGFAAGHDLTVRTQRGSGASGKYGRLLGWLYLTDSEVSLNEKMIEEGYAWEYDGGSKNKNFEELKAIRRLKGTLEDPNPPEASGPGHPLMTPTDFIP